MRQRLWFAFSRLGPEADTLVGLAVAVEKVLVSQLPWVKRFFFFLSESECLVLEILSDTFIA